MPAGGAIPAAEGKNRMIRAVTANFALMTLAGVALAWFQPALFTWMTDGSIRLVGQPLLSVALGVIMLAMGLTLSFADYRQLAHMPRALAIGLVAQFAIMPLTGFAIAQAMGLQQGLAVGLILVACCPGGTASNIVTYLARGNLALSVAMTMASTLAAVALTPMLTGALAGTYVEIDRWALFRDMLAVVLVPVVVGTLISEFLPRAARAVSEWLPLAAAVIVVLIVGGIVGGSKDLIREHAGQLLLATFLLHAFGFGLGLLTAKLLGLGPVEQRTVSIEVGMQNSGLGSGLASAPSFAAQFPTAIQAALAPVPAALSAVWHVLIGSLLASWWARRSERDEETETSSRFCSGTTIQTSPSFAESALPPAAARLAGGGVVLVRGRFLAAVRVVGCARGCVRFRRSGFGRCRFGLDHFRIRLLAAGTLGLGGRGIVGRYLSGRCLDRRFLGGLLRARAALGLRLGFDHRCFLARRCGR